MTLPLALALGLVWASGGGWGSSSPLSESRGFFLGALGEGLGLRALAGGVLSPLVPPPLLLLLLLVSPPPLPHPHPTVAMRVHAPPTPPRLPPTQPVQHGEGPIGVIPHHQAQLGDPHEVRPATAIAPLHSHPAGVGFTRLHAHKLRRQTRGWCVLAAF